MISYLALGRPAPNKKGWAAPWEPTWKTPQFLWPNPSPRRPQPASTPVTLQRLETLKWDPRGASDELQQPCTPLLIEGLHRLPEPANHVTVGPAVLQPCVALPVVQVDLVQATNDQL